ncbi:MAG: B-box zinc finger protein [Pseudomonadota bacterium]
MNSDPGNELLRFAARFLESRGAVLEIKNSELEAVLPEELSEFLKIPEYFRIKSDSGDETDVTYSIHYGSALIDKMIEAACAETPLLACELKFDYMKSDGFDRLIKAQFHFHDISVRFQSSANVRTDYLMLTCRYTAQSDEQKEGMIRLSFNYETGAFIPNMADMLSPADKIFRTEAKIPGDEKRLHKIMKQIRERSRDIIMQEIVPFRESMARRFRRDAGHLEEYYRALEKEMRSNLARQGLSDQLIRDRKGKIDLLPGELERKKDDLFKKYSIRIRIAPCAILFITTPAVKILYSMAVPGKHKTLSFIYNPIGKAIDPLVCQGCGMSMADIYCCRDLHLLCRQCRKKCPVCK